ncbi:hypothetical protein AX14_006139 [Amanita brunnescens Koide BX004]|nr:hypothetical protein AX14_006139 [Amanita brunnescens Koide BX004]
MIRTALARSRPSRFLPVCRHISTSQKTSSAHGTLPDSQSPISPELRFFNSVTGGKGLIPTYRVLDGVGQPIDGAQVPDIDEPFARKLYEHMQLLPTVDNILYNVQRQGKISFYMTAYGEEAAVIGSAAGLENDDE